ncbi:MAG: DNA gyrase inhibitor YacG [Polyangiaceae bacterium]
MRADRACPQCGKPARHRDDATAPNPAFPFCSPTCKLADLKGWLDGSYRISTDEQQPSHDEPASGIRSS